MTLKTPTVYTCAMCRVLVSKEIIQLCRGREHWSQALLCKHSSHVHNASGQLMNLYLNYITLLYISVYLFTLKHLFIQIVSLNVVAVVLDSAFALLVCQSVDLSAAVST